MNTHSSPRLRLIARLLPALAIFLNAAALKASPIAGDSFVIGKSWYTTGDNNLFPQDPTTPGFFGGWLEAFGGSASPDVTSANLVYNADATLSSGGSLLADSNGRTGRVLSTAYGDADSGTIYLSALLQTSAVTTGYRGLELHDGGFDDGANRTLQLVIGEAGIGSLDSNYVTRIYNNGAFQADLGAGDTNVNLFVIKCTFSTSADSDLIEIYRNPENLSNEGLSTIDASFTGFNFRFDRISIANFSGGDSLAVDELRVGSSWASVVGPLDSEPDGAPDAWEVANGLTVGVPDGAGDALFDNDGLINSDEFLANTDPGDEDSDDDGLKDGPEVNTYSSCPNDPDTDKDGVADGLDSQEVGGAGSLPTLVDTDGDGFADKVEIDAGSDPNLFGSTPATFLATTLIGLDYFDIVDGSIGGVVSGEGFDLDNSSERDAFTGHTATFSDWDGNAVVNGGKLQTQGGSNAFREFKGTSEGNGTNSDEREGAFDALGNFGAQRNIYFKVELSRQCDVTYSGLSLFNADGTEELFFGVLANTLEFGIEELNENNLDTTGAGPNDFEVNTIAGRLDLDAVGGPVASLWVNPTLGGSEPTASVTLNLNASNFLNEAFITRLRLESGGADVTEWDDLVVGTTWASLATAPTSSGGDPDLRDTFEATWGVSDDTANDDGDTLTNGEEQANNTNPTETDTDDDNIDDKEELEAGVDGFVTNPRLADTDGDGVNDDVEIAGTGNTFDGMPTDPTDCDSDGDGEDDGLELFNGSDPNDPLSDSSTVTDIVVNGRKDPLYGAAITVQTVNTEFGDNLSEWNAAYGRVEDGKLFLMFTGNLEDSFNKLELFIDSSSTATTEVYTGIGSNPDGVNAMNGMTFDAGFTPDYHLVFRRGFDGATNKFDLDFIDLGGGTSSFYGDLGGGVNTGFAINTGTGANAFPIGVAYDDSNTGGVVGGTGAADFGAASAAATGLEICIDLCDLGEPDNENIRIMLLQNNGSHSFLSNQSLAGMPAGTGNLGNPTTTDFGGITGDQFFSIFIPAGAANCATPDPVALSIQVVGSNAVLSWVPASTAVDLYKTDDLSGGFDPTPISTNDTDGTHSDSGVSGSRYYRAVPTGSPAP